MLVASQRQQSLQGHSFIQSQLLDGRVLRLVFGPNSDAPSHMRYTPNALEQDHMDLVTGCTGRLHLGCMNASKYLFGK